MWECSGCKGHGNLALIGCIAVPSVRLPKDLKAKQLGCPMCNGKGFITMEHMGHIEYGERVFEYRTQKLRLTLREWAFQNGIKPSTESCFETGRYWELDEDTLEMLKIYWDAMMEDYPEG